VWSPDYGWLCWIPVLLVGMGILVQLACLEQGTQMPNWESHGSLKRGIPAGVVLLELYSAIEV